MDARTAALQLRTLEFGIRVVRLAQHYPRTPAGEVIAKQLVKAATGVGASYRAASRCRSAAEFSTRMSTVLAEADQSAFWLALTGQADMISGPTVGELYEEAQELVAIFAESLLTVAHGG